MTMRGGGGLAHALACVLVLAGLVVSAGSSEMNHFTEEWEANYNHQLEMSHADCVGCNAIKPFALPGREKSCISHCELVVEPGAPDFECEAKCWQLRLAVSVTDEPCIALGMCPPQLGLSVTPRAILKTRERHTLPIVIISGGDKSRAFEDLVVKWIGKSLPDAHIRRLVLTSYSLDNEDNARDQNLVRREDGYYALRPLHAQVDRVCSLLDADANLVNGFDLVAFGHGGLLARAYVQKCNEPQVKTLITYNTPHAGCSSKNLSKTVKALWRKGGGFGPQGGERLEDWDEYSELAQQTSAAAGYYRDPRRLGDYVSGSAFLPDLNLERAPSLAQQRRQSKRSLWDQASPPEAPPQPNAKPPENAPAIDPRSADMRAAHQARTHLMQLSKLILISAERDRAVEPPTSAWFEAFHLDEHGALLLRPLIETDIYSRLGLDALDRRGDLELVRVDACEYKMLPEEALLDEWDHPCRLQILKHIILHLGKNIDPPPPALDK